MSPYEAISELLKNHFPLDPLAYAHKKAFAETEKTSLPDAQFLLPAWPTNNDSRAPFCQVVFVVEIVAVLLACCCWEKPQAYNTIEKIKARFFFTDLVVVVNSFAIPVSGKQMMIVAKIAFKLTELFNYWSYYGKKHGLNALFEVRFGKFA